MHFTVRIFGIASGLGGAFDAMVERGLDFADALHLASSTTSDRFATFDLGLVKRSRDITGIDVVAVDTRDR